MENFEQLKIKDPDREDDGVKKYKKTGGTDKEGFEKLDNRKSFSFTDEMAFNSDVEKLGFGVAGAMWREILPEEILGKFNFKQWLEIFDEIPITEQSAKQEVFNTMSAMVREKIKKEQGKEQSKDGKEAIEERDMLDKAQEKWYKLKKNKEDRSKIRRI